jgi:hypothetical protein
MGELVPASTKPLFKKVHELAKLVRSLKKVSQKAVEVLEAGLTSDDERVRMIAAEKLLKFYADMANDVRQDEIKALLLEIKVGGLIGQGSTAEDDSTPVLDFDNLNPEFANQDVQDAQFVDMGAVNKI